MASKKLYDIQNLYYCLVVAIKIEKNIGRCQSTIEENLFILSWVKNAQKKKLFPKYVLSELEWISSLVTSAKLNVNAFITLENVLAKIDSMERLIYPHE